MTFDDAAGRAAAARDKGDAVEAIRWYREGVRLQPAWDEGWWYLGALSYERRDSAQAARAFARFVALKPDSGPAWALRGLSEFGRRNYDAALRFLARGLSLGSVGNAEIRDVVYYHMAVLRIRAGQFPLASEPLAALAHAKSENPSLVAACGLFLLQMAVLPEDVPAPKQELVQAAGRAAYAALGLKPDARPRFEELLSRYPDVPNLHYGYGAYLLQQGDDVRSGRARRLPQGDRGRSEVGLRPARDRVRAARSAASTRRRCRTPSRRRSSPPACSPRTTRSGARCVETGQVPRGIARAGEGGPARARQPRDARAPSHGPT